MGNLSVLVKIGANGIFKITITICLQSNASLFVHVLTSYFKMPEIKFPEINKLVENMNTKNQLLGER